MWYRRRPFRRWPWHLGFMGPFGFYFRMGLPRRSEYRRMLEEYKAELEQELKGVEQELEELRKEEGQG